MISKRREERWKYGMKQQIFDEFWGKGRNKIVKMYAN